MADLLNKRRIRHPKRGAISAGREAAIKAGAAGTARKQPKEPAEVLSLEPGYMAERIEKSRNREKLLKARFGARVGNMVEHSRDRYNLIRKGLEMRKR